MNDFAWLVLCLGLLGMVALLALRLRAGGSGGHPVTGDISAATNAADMAALVGKNRRAEEILDHMGEGLLLLDPALRPVFANAAARHMLGFQDEDLPGRLPSEEVLATARRAVNDEQVEEILSVSFPLPMNLRVRATLLDHGDGVLVVLRDVTQEVLAQKVRREFVSHASHELKSPVASLQALAEAVLDAVKDDPESAARFSQRLVTEADRLGRLVGDLLDLSRLEDPTNIPKEPANLSLAAHREVDTIRKDADAKFISLDVRVDENVWLTGNDQQLGLMIRNLLENGIRYTPDQGRVSLEVYSGAGCAFVRVSDDGVGIPLEAQGRVFERFFRVDRARARDRGGTGLGLAIVKHVAEMHGGRVTLESNLGEGSTFTVELPAMQNDLPVSPAESIAG